jgi:hypothetical protein
MKLKYQSKYSVLSAPFLEVGLTNTYTKSPSPLHFDGLIDTGCPNTLIPETCLKTISPVRVDTTMFGFGTAKATRHDVFRVKISSLGACHEIRVSSWSNNFILLGRNFLSQYVITLDGLNSELNILEKNEYFAHVNVTFPLSGTDLLRNDNFWNR